MPRVSCVVRTEIGELTFQLLGAEEALAHVVCAVEAFPVQPPLPEGMSVRCATAVVLTIQARSEVADLHFDCRWKQAPGIGGPASGQRLDAQSWEAHGNLVVVGTEDGEALYVRLPECGISEDDYPVSYLLDGFDIRIPRIELGLSVTLHYVVAENPFPEPAEDSAWFAVDINHQQLMEWKKS